MKMINSKKRPNRKNKFGTIAVGFCIILLGLGSLSMKPKPAYELSPNYDLPIVWYINVLHCDCDDEDGKKSVCLPIITYEECITTCVCAITLCGTPCLPPE